MTVLIHLMQIARWNYRGRSDLILSSYDHGDREKYSLIIRNVLSDPGFDERQLKRRGLS